MCLRRVQRETGIQRDGKGMSRRVEKGGEREEINLSIVFFVSHVAHDFACDCCICKASGQRAADYAKAIGLRMGKLEGTCFCFDVMQKSAGSDSVKSLNIDEIFDKHIKSPFS